MSSYYCQKCKHRLLALDADCIVCQQAEQITAIKAEVNRLRTIVDNESNMPLKQEKAYSKDCKKQLAGTRAIVEQQAEQITNLQDEAEQIAEDLEDADEVIARLKEFVKRVDDSIIEQTYANEWICDALRELKAAQPQGGSDE